MRSPLRFAPLLLAPLAVWSCGTGPPPQTAAAYREPAPVSSESVPPRVTEVSPVADYRDVISLYRAKLSEDLIVQTIRDDRPVYDLQADQLIELRNTGVSERVIQTMIDSGRGPEAVTAAVVPPPPGF